MKSIFKLLSFILLFFALFLQSFAINAPANLKLDSSSDSSVNLSWDVTENAYMYYVYYSKKSWLVNWYDMQSDFIDGNSIVINGLETGTTYYFTVVALDQVWDESSFSNELVIDTNQVLDTWVTFALDSISMISSNTIELTFTSPLNNSVDAIREFKISNKADSSDTYEVLSTELNSNDNSKLTLVLDRNPEIWKEYEVVIIAITSSDGKNIESWIDNTETFIAEEIITVDALIVEDIILNELVDLNSASEVPVWPTWANIESNVIENTTLALAENNSALPKTWPEHILMLILSIILWALIFIFKYKKA